jgi:hypothetical protein
MGSSSRKREETRPLAGAPEANTEVESLRGKLEHE